MENAVISKIKAEIDKRYAEYREKMKSDDFTYYEGMADALDLFEQFIDTLELKKPVPKDLEEAADNHIRKVADTAGHPGWNWTTQDIADAFIAGAEWQADHTPLPEDTVLFNKGVEEGKRLMMEDAVEGVLVDNVDGTQEICLHGNRYGDKVRIIILPNED